jgi:hypothetical protein
LKLATRRWISSRSDPPQFIGSSLAGSGRIDSGFPIEEGNWERRLRAKSIVSDTSASSSAFQSLMAVPPNPI